MISLNSMRKIVRSGVNKQIRERMRAQVLFQSKVDSSVAFCIVHWNAPEFLILNVRQIELLHPNSKIYVLDNGSQQINLTSIYTHLKEYKNITLLSLRGCPEWGKKFGLDSLFEWQTYATGLQFLLNYSAKQSDEIAVFLDQDCILTRCVDPFFSKFDKEVILIGARDRWRGHAYSKLVHNSFMILQPKRIHQIFGNSSFYDPRAESFGPNLGDHAGISFKALGRILYLEPQMHAKIPLLTSYMYNETIYAWHAWYSSRSIGAATNNASIDGYPISWLNDVNKIEYDFMMQIHKNTAVKLHVL
jgi:hypothetical protein